VGDYQLCGGAWVYGATLAPSAFVCAVVNSPFTLSGMDLQLTGGCGYVVGQTALGGKIAYILQPGDPGYDANNQHGLVVSLSDLGQYAWWNGSYTYINATSTNIGTGLANTNTIISNQGAGTYAATIAKNHNGGGYSDWYLPSKNELNKLYLNKSLIGMSNSNYYWTSSEVAFSAVSAWMQEFNTGIQYPNPTGPTKDTNQYVRAVRSF